MKEHVAVVTGANRGIGAEIARQLEARAMRVVRTSREPAAAFTTLDVTRPEQIASLASGLARDGGVDALVNNAGVSLDGFGVEVARRTLDVNFYGAMRVTDALLPSLREGASIVMISSGMGDLSCVRGHARERIASPDLRRDELVALVESFVEAVRRGDHAREGWPSNAYSVSKVAMNALVRVLAHELEGDPRGIRVNAENPGWVRTRMGGRSAPRSVEEGARTAVWLATLPAGGPTGGLFRDETQIPW
jgi:carbonyl reductase 1